MSNGFTAIERNTVAALCALSLLLFFVPLLTIHVPIAGDQEVSGYDVFSKLNGVRDNLKSSDAQPQRDATASAPDTATSPTSPPPNLPLSVETSWMIPVEIVVAFLCAGIALVGAVTSLRVARVASTVGACVAAIAILHITRMNSDMHSWLATAIKSDEAGLKDNPFAGLAQGMGDLIANAYQLKPGWGLYSLLVLLAVVTAIGFSRVLSRLQLAPNSK